MKRIIHVNMHHIRRNRKEGSHLPVISVKTYKSTDYGHQAVIRLPDGTEVGRFVYRPDQPLSCGARLWFETTNNVQVIEEPLTHKEDKP